MEGVGRKKTVCVTGAGGFVASWLVKLLLSRGCYVVRGTVRDPSDPKNAHLAALDGAAERLQLFKGDLLDYDSMAAAIAGCDDVFHAACPVPATPTAYPENDLVNPAVLGTKNVMKACCKAKVKRVVVVSSLSSVMENPSWPKGKAMDENSWSDVRYCSNNENWYCVAKTLAEIEAFKFHSGKKSRLDVVTVCPSLVIGPMLQPTVNASSSVIVDYLKGDRAVKLKRRCFVDVRDVADALLLVYETPEASGRFVCDAHAREVSDVIQLLKNMYPAYKFAKKFIKWQDDPLFNSRKLKKLGWKTKPFEETLVDSVESYRAAGILD